LQSENHQRDSAILTTQEKTIQKYFEKSDLAIQTIFDNRNNNIVMQSETKGISLFFFFLIFLSQFSIIYSI